MTSHEDEGASVIILQIKYEIYYVIDRSVRIDMESICSLETKNRSNIIRQT